MSASLPALGERLARMTDDELRALLPNASYDQGWGASSTIHVDGAPVFVKRLPLADVEVERPRSTRNWFRLPVWYSYGVGSAGFGSWREVVAHESTTGVDGFPELLHTRVLPRTAGPRSLPWSAEEYVAYWRGNDAIGRYMAARAAAGHEVWVVLEHVPETGQQWLLAHQDQAEVVLGSLFAALDRLADAGIVHFDSHLNNVVTDGACFKLTDFGLAVAESFELSAAERRFLDRHRFYDRGVALASLGQMLMGALGHRDPRRLAADIDALDDGPVPYDAALRAVFRRCKAPIVYMVEHFARMMRPSKRSTYDDGVLRDLLGAAGVPT